MSKAKQTNLKKGAAIIGIIALAAVIIFIINNLSNEPAAPSAGKEEGTKMQNENPFPFKKQGELSFLGKGGKISSTIDIEIADTELARQQGLMFRTSMEDNQGMLFIFEREAMQSFWMKNTILPLDIMYVNKDKEIIKIHKNTMPFQEEPGYESGRPAMYVVEVKAGYTDVHGIKEGDRINFTRTNK